MPEFPLVTLRGGPTGAPLTLEIDGKPAAGTVDVTIEAKAHNHVTTTLRRITRVDVEVRSEVVDGALIFEVVVRYPATDTEISEVAARAKADTPWEALYDCGRTMELNAARRVARGGTI